MAIHTDNIKEGIEKGADAVQNTASTVADKVPEVIGKLKGRAEDVVGNGRDTLENALSCSKDMIRANPITALAVFAAVGYLWGRLRK